jgi:sialate O-acetylesterase
MALMEKHKERLAQAKADGKPAPLAPETPKSPPGDPASHYHAMIRPLVPYGIRGVIWYQGEANRGLPRFYRELFPAMIRNWRADWGQGDFPFLFVQLANFRGRDPYPSEKAIWAETREVQLQSLAVPKTGMAVTIDIGEPGNIHPRNKQDVGKRLALAAQAVAYGKDLVYSARSTNRCRWTATRSASNSGTSAAVWPPREMC